MLLLALLFNAAYAYTIKGLVTGFESRDVQTTAVLIENDATYEKELISSKGNFALRDVLDGEYKLSLLSTTLNDAGYFILKLDQGELSVTRIEADGIEHEASHPIEFSPTRRANLHERRKPRLRDIYSDKMVLFAVLGLGALTVLPKLIMNMEEEDLKLLEMKGDGSAFEMAQKFANAHTQG